MAAGTQLPAACGRVYVFVVIAVGLVLAVIGIPGRVSAHPRSHPQPHPLSRKIDALVGVAAEAVNAMPADTPAVLVLPLISPPSLHPAPGNGHSTSTRPSMSHPAAPVPMPQTPPTQRSADADGAAPQAVVVPDADLHAASVIRPAPNTRRTALRRTHASSAITSDGLDRSLVYSSALALAIAAGGLLLIGSRRRLW